jgi:hypothetical protein
MSARNTFIQQYQTADGRKPAPPGLIKAACLYVLELKRHGFSLPDISARVEKLIRSAGGHTPESARLDADIHIHCVEEFHRPLPNSHPKPPDFLG